MQRVYFIIVNLLTAGTTGLVEYSLQNDEFNTLRLLIRAEMFSGNVQRMRRVIKVGE